MSDPRPDADLREWFQELRSEDGAAAPDFAEMMAGIRPALDEPGDPVTAGTETRLLGRRRSRWFWAGGSLAAAAAVATLLLFNPGARADREFERTVRSFAESTQWTSPTDMLLDLPGSEVTRSVPQIGTSDWPGASGTSRRLRS